MSINRNKLNLGIQRISAKITLFTLAITSMIVLNSWAQSNDIDVFKIITDISSAFYTIQELNYSSNQLDEMLKSLSERLVSINSKEEKIEILNDFLFKEMQFQYEKSLDNVKFALLPSVVKERKGNCIGLSTLYLYLGQKLNLPICAVVAPNHIFVRLKDYQKPVNIELGDFGNAHSYQEYTERFGISKEMDDAIYMKDLTNQEFVGIIYCNLGVIFLKKGDLPNAIKMLENSQSLIKGLPESYSNLGVAYLSSGRIDDAIIQFNEALKYNPVNARTYSNLGSAYDDKKEYGLAISSYKKALQIEPDSVAIKNNLAIAEKHKQGRNQIR